MQHSAQEAREGQRQFDLHCKRRIVEKLKGQIQNGLKEKIEQLEKQLSEQRATETIAELQGKVPTSDEVENLLSFTKI